MAEDPVFVLLKQPVGWIPGARWSGILGAVVQNCLSPLSNKVPKEPWTCDEKTWYETKLDHFVLGATMKKTRASRLSLDGLFTLAGSNAELSELDLRGQRVTLRRLEQVGDFWKQLCTDHPELDAQAREWQAEGKDLFGRSTGPYWVTGVLVCQAVTIAASETDYRERRARGDVPIGTLGELVGASFGCPINLHGLANVVGEVSKVDETSTCLIAQGAETYTFGLEVRQVVKKKDSLETRNKQPKLPSNRKLGGSHRGGEESGELVPQKLDDKALDYLIEE